ncbi:hypothetical protein ACFOWZ_14810 [Lentzea rhizosphaerae]|uniref:Secreted protein n=1 Tax=Lentzea rhizosphaerae TaxID=2041025 RepID=A0ABV8BR36_9PSEU
MEDGRRNARPAPPARLLSAVAVVVALAGVAFGGWLIWGGQPLPASARNLAPTGEEGRLAADPLAIADFDSGLESYAYIRSWTDVEELQFLSRAEVDTYESGDAGAARVVVSSRRPEGKLIIAVVQMRDRAAAVEVADELDDLQFEAGFERRDPEPNTSVERQVEVFPLLGKSDSQERKPVARAHYVHGDLVVRMELHAKTAEDVTERFGGLLARQLKVLPADG